MSDWWKEIDQGRAIEMGSILGIPGFWVPPPPSPKIPRFHGDRGNSTQIIERVRLKGKVFRSKNLGHSLGTCPGMRLGDKNHLHPAVRHSREKERVGERTQVTVQRD